MCRYEHEHLCPWKIAMPWVQALFPVPLAHAFPWIPLVAFPSWNPNFLHYKALHAFLVLMYLLITLQQQRSFRVLRVLQSHRTCQGEVVHELARKPRGLHWWEWFVWGGLQCRPARRPSWGGEWAFWAVRAWRVRGHGLGMIWVRNESWSWRWGEGLQAYWVTKVGKWWWCWDEWRYLREKEEALGVWISLHYVKY